MEGKNRQLVLVSHKPATRCLYTPSSHFMTFAVMTISVTSTLVTVIIPPAAIVFNPPLSAFSFRFTTFSTSKTLMPSTSISIFLTVRIKVIEVTKNRASSNGPSRSDGSRKAIENVVQGLPEREDRLSTDFGRWPDRASSLSFPSFQWKAIHLSPDSTNGPSVILLQPSTAHQRQIEAHRIR